MGAVWRAEIGDPTIRRMDSGSETSERTRLVQAFSPLANNKPELAGSEAEVDILVSTDVLSEGQNLQDCGVVLNYDLHWNPTRMVQRAGRVDRIGSEFEQIAIYNLFLEEGSGVFARVGGKVEQEDCPDRCHGFSGCQCAGRNRAPA